LDVRGIEAGKMAFLKFDRVDPGPGGLAVRPGVSLKLIGRSGENLREM